MDTMNMDLVRMARGLTRAGPSDTQERTKRDALPSRGIRSVILGALVLLVVAILVAAAGALGPYVVGFVYMVVAYPLVQALARRGVPRWASVLAVFGITILVGLTFVIFVVGFLGQSTTFMTSTGRWLSDSIHGLLTQLAIAGSSQPSDVARFYDSVELLAGRITSGILSVVSPPGSGPLGVLGTIIAFGTIPFWSFYLMKDWPKLSDRLDRRLPATWAPDIRFVLATIGSSFSTWVRGQLAASVVAGAFTFIEFQILGVLIDPVFSDVAFVMAAIGFAFEMIPSIGPTIALIPYLLVGAAAGGVGIVAVFIGWVIAQQLENAWIVPHVQSRATDLHPAVILTVLVIGGSIHGLLGAIIAVPITSAMWRIADHYLPQGDAQPATDRSAVHRAASSEKTGQLLAPGMVAATPGPTDG